MNDLENNLNKLAVTAGVMDLYLTALHDDPSKELYGEVTKAEKELIISYSHKKGLIDTEINGIEDLILNPKSRELIQKLGWPKEILKNFGDYIFLNILPFEDMKTFAKIAWSNNRRIDPEELRLLEKMLTLEGYMTPKMIEKFYELIAPYNLGKKITLMIHGNEAAMKYYTDQFNQAGFDVKTLQANLKDNTQSRFVDRNHGGESNMFIISPDTYPEKEKQKLIRFLGDPSVKNVPKMAIDVAKGSTPKQYNVDAIILSGATMLAKLEEAQELFTRFYLGLHGAQNGG